MASAQSVVRSLVPGFIDHLFYPKTDSIYDREQQEITAYRLFCAFVALKIAIPFADFHWPLSIKTLGVFFIILMASWPRLHRLGLLGVLGLSFYECFRAWPFTINHTGLEFGIVLLMVVLPKRESTPGVKPADLIKILMLSVWFYSGLHKLFDGYYVNGEFFALETLSNTTPLGHHLNDLLSFLGPLKSQAFSCCTTDGFYFNAWQTAMLFGLSWVTILVEILLPILVLPSVLPSRVSLRRDDGKGSFGLLNRLMTWSLEQAFRLKPFFIATLFIAQGFIAYFSGEIDFAFTAYAILFLLTPKWVRYLYPTMTILFLWVQPWH